MYNKIIALGRLGADPEYRVTEQGINIANMRIATTTKVKDEERTTWLRVVSFGKIAESVYKFLKKGRLIYVEGNLQEREYKDKENNVHKIYEVIASKVIFMPNGNNTNVSETATNGANNVVGKDDDDVIVPEEVEEIFS